MEIKKQCKNALIINKKPVDIFYCVRDKGHKGKHIGWGAWNKKRKKWNEFYWK